MTTRWLAAQRVERKFWDRYDGSNRHHQRWLLGVLGVSFGFQCPSVIDLGGGPESVLLSIPRADVERAIVIDPMELNFREESRYRAADIEYFRAKAEDIHDRTLHPELAGVDAEEVWLYNVLQHVDDVAATIQAATLLASSRIRICEWLHEPVEVHHPHSLAPSDITQAIPSGIGGWYIEQEVTGTIRTEQFKKQFMATVWRRRDRGAVDG